MLLLVGLDRALGTIWWPKPGTELAVGRKGTPLLVEGDHSVSRRHATITLTIGAQPKAEIKDEGSKFGVYVNGRRCGEKQTAEAKIGDNVTFGGQSSTFQLRDCPVSFCLANMSSMPGLSDISATASSLGIGITKDVDSCTHLMTPALTVTSKVIKALVYGRWIVSPDYIHAIADMPMIIKVDSPTPSTVDRFVASLGFLPVSSAPMVPPASPVDLSAVSWNPDPKRQALFTSKLFVFVDEPQHNRYGSLIRMSGGAGTMVDNVAQRILAGSRSPYEMESQASLASKEIVAHLPDAGHMICIVLPPPLSRSAQEQDGVTMLAKAIARILRVRPIAESEIGLAVLFVSCADSTNSALHEQSRLAQAQVSEGTKAVCASKPDEQPKPDEEKAPSQLASAPSAVVTATSKRRSGRRKIGMDSFWSKMISGEPEEPQPTTAASGKAAGDAQSTTAAVCPSDSGAQRQDSSQMSEKPTGGQTTDGNPGNTTSEAQNEQPHQPTHIEALSATTSLIKPKARTHSSQHTQNASLSNFKRFKKTVHLYQQA
ncbi:hypothetical protein GGI12_000451 [Dipsacomyces acuminosporus]|nr:hypothetical protein GGI12_000451 [Dipsacomyces acuminosporus]